MSLENSVDIPGYEGKYKIDTNGNVYSRGQCAKNSTWNKITGQICKNNRAYITLWSRSKYDTWLVHRLVYTVFVRSLLSSEEIDHINRNPLDNRLVNLRTASSLQNKFNSSKRKNVKYKGVESRLYNNKYRVRCANKHIGVYCTEVKAAVAYDLAAIENAGQFAHTNFLTIADNLLAKEDVSR